MYVNWGRLVADCGSCSDARTVDPGQRMMRCVGGHSTELVWDPTLPAVMTVLAERPEEKNRNWFPSDHPLALRIGQVHGQTVTELQHEHAFAIESEGI